MGFGLGLAWTVTVTVLAVVTVTVAGPHVVPAGPDPPETPDGEPGELDCPACPRLPGAADPVVVGDWPPAGTELVTATGMSLIVDLIVTMPVPVAVAAPVDEFPAGKGTPEECVEGKGA